MRLDRDALTRAGAAPTLDDMGEPAIGTRKWSRQEYERLVEAEILVLPLHVMKEGGPGPSS